MKRFLFILAVLLAVPSLARAADGGTVSEPAAYRRIQEIVRVLQGNLAPEKVFAPAFLSAVPPAQLDAIARQLVAANGALLGAENVRDDGKGGTTFDIVYAHGRGPAQIHLGPAPRFLVTGFNIGAVLPANDTPQKILEDIEALPGVTGALLELNPHHPSLRLHALSGRLAGVHSVSINLSYRITLHLLVTEREIIPLNVGDHDAVY